MNTIHFRKFFINRHSKCKPHTRVDILRRFSETKQFHPYIDSPLLNGNIQCIKFYIHNLELLALNVWMNKNKGLKVFSMVKFYLFLL